MRSESGRALTLLVVAVVVLLVASSVGQPVVLSYVRTGSMAPTLESGDGFVSVPAAIAGPPEEGDVIIYRAQELDGGGLTTHRVVGETEAGYITQGDANPFTDQSAGEPPVPRRRIVAVGVGIGGQLLVIPELGTAVVTVRELAGGVADSLGLPTGPGASNLWFGAAAAGLVLLLFGTSSGRRSRPTAGERGRDRDRDETPTLTVRRAALLAGALVVVVATASMVLPLGPTEFEVVSAESDVPGPGVIPAGESENATYRISGGGLFPTRYYVEPRGEGIAVTNGSGVVEPGETANATVTLSVPEELGVYRRAVSVDRYPLLLPAPVVDALYRLHPLAPVIAVDALVAVPFLVVARLSNLGGRSRTRGRRDRSRESGRR